MIVYLLTNIIYDFELQPCSNKVITYFSILQKQKHEKIYHNGSNIQNTKFTIKDTLIKDGEQNCRIKEKGKVIYQLNIVLEKSP